MRQIVFILFISLSLSLFAATKVYKKVNSDGSVEYSDVPFAEGGEPIKLKPLPSVSLTPLVPSTHSAPAAAPAKPFQYESIRILSPQDDEAIRSNNGNISFRGELRPGLQSNLEHHIEWLLDGKVIPSVSGLNPSLKNLDRGTHQLQLRVVNFKGKAVIQTSPISFHILRVRLGRENIYAPTPVAP